MRREPEIVRELKERFSEKKVVRDKTKKSVFDKISKFKKYNLQGIRTKILIGFLLVGFIPLLTAQVVNSDLIEDSLEDEAYGHLETACQAKAEHITTLIEDYMTTAELIANNEVFSNLLIADSDDVDYNEKLSESKLELEETIQIHSCFEHIHILDLDGFIITSTNDDYIGRNKKFEIMFIKGLKATFFREIHFAEDTNDPVMGISTPIQYKEDVVGVLITRIKTLKLFKILMDKTGWGESGETFIVNSDRYMISPSRFIDEAVLTLKVESENVENAFSMKDNHNEDTSGAPEVHTHHVGHEAVSIYEDYRGVEVLGTHVYIDETNWALLAEIDLEEAIAPVEEMKTNIILMSFIFTIFIVFVSIFYSNSIIKPVKELQKGTEIIGSGNLDYSINVKSNDEMKDLSNSFNVMASNLKESHQMLNSVNKQLEEKVEERTKELQLKNLELEKTNKRLGMVNESLDNFAYSVAHDLRQPLRGMSGFAKILVEDYSDKVDDTMKHYLNRINYNTQKMGRLIDDLLLISSSDKHNMNIKETNVKKIIQKISKKQKEILSDRKIHFEISDMPNIYSDPKMIEIIFYNLISNAVKFSLDKKEVKIEIGSNIKDNFIEFYVKDYGVGFDMIYKDKIFKPFQRLHSEKKYSGIGTGLAIVKKVINRLNGKIWVESKKGEGSIFYFSIPLKKVDLLS